MVFEKSFNVLEYNRILQWLVNKSSTHEQFKPLILIGKHLKSGLQVYPQGLNTYRKQRGGLFLDKLLYVQ